MPASLNVRSGSTPTTGYSFFQSSVYFSREDFPKIPPARPMKWATPIETYSGEGILRVLSRRRTFQKKDHVVYLKNPRTL